MKYFRSKLTKKYLLLSLLGSIVSLTIIFVIATFVLNHSIREQIDERNELMAKTLSSHTDLVIQQIVSEINSVSPYVMDQEGEVVGVYEELTELVLQNAFFSYLNIFNEEGERVLSVPDHLDFPDNKLEEIRQRLRWSKTHHISNLVTLEDGTPTIAITVPILSEEGEFRGGISALVDLESLSTALSQVQVGQEGMNALIDRNGRVIAHQNESLIGEPLHMHPIHDLLSKRRIGHWEGIIFSQKMLLAYRPVLTSEFGLIVGETEKQALVPVVSVQKVLIEGFLIVSFLTVLFTIFGTTSVVKPITNLINQAKEYKDGKRSNFALVSTNDELQDLSVTMHSMAKELTNKGRRLASILESIPYAVITLDQTGKILTFNNGAEQLTGYSKKEAVGKLIFNVPLKSTTGEGNVSWGKFLDGREFHEVEASLVDTKNREFEVSIYSSRFRDQIKNKVATLLIIRDVSEVKKLENYVKQNERLASLGQLTSGIAHEIKNPLSIIQAASEAIQYETMDGEVDKSFIKELSNDIVETTERMNLLLTDFLKMAKDEHDVSTEKVNVVLILDELLLLLRKKFDDHQITVKSEYQKFDSAYVLSHRSKLGQVFLNIILNSIQAMESGGELSMNIKEGASNWEVEFRDTGHGIPPSKINWIFNPFFSTKKEGTGLGLSIAYEIITQQGGEIRAKSEEGKGTSIFIVLPKCPEEGENLGEVDITS
ncbi:sensor histidine kinase [Bacillus sp. FJAT-44742]|uniref:sensor histidine kinase n=1 Tax=Bacillus sp. FJAT-44742 TaxID=2014005 RepID=UPI000C237858|nr:PAS domain-containing sensor histidine kinase [Bacillus sp. FJAT-44742]